MGSLAPRWFLVAHLRGLFEGQEEQNEDQENTQDTGDERSEDEEPIRRLPTAGNENLILSNRTTRDWISRGGAQDRSFRGTPRRERTADARASETNPDATPMRWSGSARRKLGYQTHYVVDGGKARVFLSVLVTPGKVSENRPVIGLLWRTAFGWKLRPHHVTGDGKYGTMENIAGVEGRASTLIWGCTKPEGVAATTSRRAPSPTTQSRTSTCARQGRL